MEVKTELANTTLKSWVNLYSDSLYSWAFYKTSDKETAEDLVQETFLAAYQNFEKFGNKSEAKTWLFSILKNKIADHFRKSFRNSENATVSFNNFFDRNGDWIIEQRPQNWEPEEGHLLDNFDFQETLRNCLDKLPEQWNSSVTLKFMEEKESNEICQELSISTTNFWQIIHRAKLQLRKCLELNWFKK